jgi:hypothetical protein
LIQAGYDSLEKIQKMSHYELAAVDNLGEIRAKVILTWLKKKADLINENSAHLLDQQFTQSLTALINANRDELLALEEKHQKGLISEKTYNDEIKRIKDKFAYDSLMLSIDKAEKELEILKTSGADIVQAEKDLAQMRLEAQQMITSGTSQADEKKAGEITIKEILEAGVEAAQNTADAVFQIGADRRAAELDAELSKLDAQRERELSNKNLTEKQKEAKVFVMASAPLIKA